MDLDRLKHSISVARKMVEIGETYNLTNEQLQELFLLGFNHDIGYEFNKNGIEHNVTGGNILKDSNYKYWKEVYYHGEPDSPYNSLFLDILNMADMQIDKYGNDVGYNERLEDIKKRYGYDSKPYKCCKKLISNFKKNKTNS